MVGRANREQSKVGDAVSHNPNEVIAFLVGLLSAFAPGTLFVVLWTRGLASAKEQAALELEQAERSERERRARV